MAVTIVSFRNSYPEFASADDVLLTRKLAISEQSVPTDIDDSLRDVWVEACMAYHVSTTPGARALRKQPQGGGGIDSAESVYEREWLRIHEVLGIGGLST